MACWFWKSDEDRHGPDKRARLSSPYSFGALDSGKKTMDSPVNGGRKLQLHS